MAQLGRLVEQAAAQRSPLEGAVAKFARFYTPVVLVAALCIAFVPWAVKSDHKVRSMGYLLASVPACPTCMLMSPQSSLMWGWADRNALKERMQKRRARPQLESSQAASRPAARVTAALLLSKD